MSQDLAGTTFEPDAEPEAASNGSAPEGFDARVDTSRRRWPWFLVGAAVGVGGVIAADAVRAVDEQDATAVQEVVEVSTAPVTRQDLVEEVEWSGSLSSGLAVEVPAPGAGVVTDAAAEGSTVDRGDTIAELDGAPVVVMIGDVPMWRVIDVETEGEDVRQLETNLVALGFDTDDDVVVDDEFDAATEEMVERWEESLGLEPTGVVPVERVVVVPGPADVAVAATIGATTQPGQPLAQLDVPAEVIDVVGAARTDDGAGQVTRIAATGTAVEHGTVLARVDGKRVVAVVDDTPEIDVMLDALETGDVEFVEATLRYLGFDPNEQMVIDGEVDQFTTRAVRRWQESVGLPTSGSIARHDYAVVPGAADAPYAVGAALVDDGDLVGRGAVLMQLTSPTLTVSGDVAVPEIDEFDVGDTVQVEQLDESTFEAVVASIADVANEPATPEEEATITVTFDVVGESEEFVSGAVVVLTESSRVDGAMVVPTRALVTLREGGFAVDKELPDGRTELVGVELGTFDDGVVEIAEVTSGSLAIGDAVVVPS